MVAFAAKASRAGEAEANAAGAFFALLEQFVVGGGWVCKLNRFDGKGGVF